MDEDSNSLGKKAIYRYQSKGASGIYHGFRGIVRNKWKETIYSFIKRTNNPKDNLQKYIRFRRTLQPYRYSYADPFKIIYVDPDKINYRVQNCVKAWGRVTAEEWETVPFEDVTIHGESLHESNVLHFVDGVPWEETPVYKSRMDNLDQNIRGWSSNDEVEAFFVSLDNLYQSMKQDGYLTQQQLLERNPEMTRSKNNDAFHPTANEIGVNIYKNGEVFLGHCGQHRLSIAKILNISHVPVQVRTRHTRWEQIRRQVSAGNTVRSEFRHHPDLQDVQQDST